MKSIVFFKINFIHISKVELSYNFLSFIKTVKQNDISIEYNIPEKYFSENKETLPICFEVECLNLKHKFYFDLFYGDNEAHLFINSIGKTYQLFFKNIDNIEVISDDIHINSYDTNGTKDRKRVLLINYIYNSVEINKKYISLNQYYLRDENYKLADSYVYSFYDINKFLILSKRKYIFETLKINEIIKKSSEKMKLIIKKINGLRNSANKEKYNKIYSKLRNYNLNKFNIEINLSKKELVKNAQNILSFIYDKTFITIILYFINKFNLDYPCFLKLFDYTMQQLSKIIKDNKLKIYQKILIMEQFGLSSIKFNEIVEFLSSNFEYYLFDGVENNSILFFVKEFLNKFIDKIEEEIPLFFILLELSSGFSFYRDELFYSFDMKNLKEIKSYLRDIFLDIITFYTNNNKNNNYSFFSNKYLSNLTINTKVLFIGNKKFKLNKKIENINIIEGEKIASKIIIFYFIEIFKNILYCFSKSKYLKSECNIDKRLIDKLIQLNCDSKYYLYKLIDRADLFLGNLNTLINYIKYKFYFKHYKQDNNINDKEDNLTIEQEIEKKFEIIGLVFEKMEKDDKISEEMKEDNKNGIHMELNYKNEDKNELKNKPEYTEEEIIKIFRIKSNDHNKEFKEKVLKIKKLFRDKNIKINENKTNDKGQK